MALKHYSHYRNSDAATQMWEVVSPALFEVYLTFPNILSGKIGNPELMFQHVRSISGLDGLTPTVGNVVFGNDTTIFHDTPSCQLQCRIDFIYSGLTFVHGKYFYSSPLNAFLSNACLRSLQSRILLL